MPKNIPPCFDYINNHYNINMKWDHLITCSAIVKEIGTMSFSNIITERKTRTKVSLIDEDPLISSQLQFLVNSTVKGDMAGKWLLIQS